MKKIKKILAIILCLSLFTAIAMGSGESEEDDEKGTGNVGSDGKTLPTIEEQVLLDKEGIVITAKEYVDDAIWGEGIKLQIENNSTQDVMVSCKALIVNNYMISDLFATEMAAGKKSNETLYLSSTELEAAGIDSVGQIEIYFHVYDTNTYADLFVSDCVTIKTSQYENMDTTPDDLGTELYNNGGIRIVGKAVDENSFWGAGILVYCENKSGKNIQITVDDVSVNGFMIEPVFAATVYNNKMAFSDITIFSSDLEENGISSINEMQLKFNIFDADTFDTIATTGTISFKVK